MAQASRYSDDGADTAALGVREFAGLQFRNDIGQRALLRTP